MPLNHIEFHWSNNKFDVHQRICIKAVLERATQWMMDDHRVTDVYVTAKRIEIRHADTHATIYHYKNGSVLFTYMRTLQNYTHGSIYQLESVTDV
tara:strand:+ start:15000 stop:15284 length:285 start_codon:yes stop_codon:yes gene_type:complete